MKSALLSALFVALWLSAQTPLDDPKFVEWLKAESILQQAIPTFPPRAPLSHRALSAVAADTVPSWYAGSTLTVPQSALHYDPASHGITISLDDLRADAETADKWAADASRECACPTTKVTANGVVRVGGYDWLRGNPAAYRDWKEHSGGEDPITWLCKAGYDSPLAKFTAAFPINRTVDDLNLTQITVQYNGVDYPGWIPRVDCLAGCQVFATVPCTSERQPTVVKMREPGADHDEVCIWIQYYAPWQRWIGGRMPSCGASR